MSTTEDVKQLYMEYPYPKYEYTWDMDPDKGPNLKTPITLKMINHYGFNGKKNFKNFRVLVAGCGLGTDLIHLAMYLKKYNGTVIGIDISTSSLNILQGRLQIYNIKNVTLYHASILNLDPKKIGKFDFINCVGVLHHLKDPVEGLNKLHSVLKEDGLIYMMVYAQYGRTGIYQMQELMRRINKNTPTYTKKIVNFKHIYAQLPKTHLLKHFERVVSDHTVSDNGIVDELLHCQDRAYTIPQLYEYAQNCELNIISHIEHSTRKKLTTPIPNVDYTNMSRIEKEAINELYHGDITKHSVFLSKQKNSIASVYDYENIPVFNFIQKDQLIKIINNTKKSSTFILSWNLEYKELFEEKYEYNYPLTEKMHLNSVLHKTLFDLLEYIDNKRTLQQIIDILRKKHNSSENDIKNAINWLNRMFIQKDLILLQHPSSDI